MLFRKQMLACLIGIVIGVSATMVFAGPAAIVHPLGPQQAQAATTDRYQDYIMCTGAVAGNQRNPTDGLWMLDYRSGKLLGTVIDRTAGKIGGWAEVDMVTEFNLPPKADVHFMMTTGTISQGQAALYVAEVTSGKFGVYTMGPAADGTGVIIRRHDQTTFRAPKPGP
jgi:hypothetical protein